MKRILDCTATDFRKMNGQVLKESIRASEGRTILAETMVSTSPLYPTVTNAELAASFGTDLLLLNLFDVDYPQIEGFKPSHESVVIKEFKQLTGRPIGLNLEPVDPNAEHIAELNHLPWGRIATKNALHKAKKLDFDFICLTGNPNTGVSNQAITHAIQQTRQILGESGLIIAGKMHGAGVSNESADDIITTKDIEQFIHAGADIVLLPAPGTVPGMTVNKAQSYIQAIHKGHALAMLSIGTSQEGADETTIKQIALNSKMAGADLHHIGDTGYYGIAVPENIMTYSIAIRGRRHTYVRMATSINR